MLVDAAAPLPATEDDAQVIDIDGLHAEQHCEEPLQRFRVDARRHRRRRMPTSPRPLRGEAGEPVRVALDLVWETDGIPYAWRQSTRYEIPCRVTGTVTVGDEEIAFSGPGQRDHSWGARDWWAVDWMWSGTAPRRRHPHARRRRSADARRPASATSSATASWCEIESVNATQEVAANELITSARIESGPDELVIDVEPVAFGAIRLEAPDGRVSFFPRAMCRVRPPTAAPESAGWSGIACSATDLERVSLRTGTRARGQRCSRHESR